MREMKHQWKLHKYSYVPKIIVIKDTLNYFLLMSLSSVSHCHTSYTVSNNNLYLHLITLHGNNKYPLEVNFPSQNLEQFWKSSLPEIVTNI